MDTSIFIELFEMVLSFFKNPHVAILFLFLILFIHELKITRLEKLPSNRDFIGRKRKKK